MQNSVLRAARRLPLPRLLPPRCQANPVASAAMIARPMPDSAPNAPSALPWPPLPQRRRRLCRNRSLRPPSSPCLNLPRRQWRNLTRTCPRARTRTCCRTRQRAQSARRQATAWPSPQADCRSRRSGSAAGRCRRVLFPVKQAASVAAGTRATCAAGTCACCREAAGHQRPCARWRHGGRACRDASGARPGASTGCRPCARARACTSASPCTCPGRGKARQARQGRTASRPRQQG